MVGRVGASRPAEPGDLDGLLALEHAAFASDRLDRRALRHAIGSRSILALVVDGQDRGIAAYALVETRRGSAIGRLSSIAVSPAAAGRGTGRALLRDAEAAAAGAGCRLLRLEVRADNAAAIRLYEREGYVLIGREPDYYEDGETALRFEKALG